MPLWSKEETVAGQPKWLSKMHLPTGTTIVLIDNDEAGLSENTSIGISTPGWWLKKTWVNASGESQYSNELLVSMDDVPPPPELP
jgi:hypothetical protein